MAPVQRRKAKAYLLAMIAIHLLLPSAVTAQVRELAKADGGIVYGTDRFSVTVRTTGTVANVKCGQTLLFPFISLYTNPHSTENGAAVRACQAESPGLGDRALEVRVTLADSKAIIEIRRECSHPKVYNNAPLWSLEETIIVEPSGKLCVTYDCLFHRITRWSGLASVCAGAMPAFKEQTFRALVPGGYLSGVIPAGLPNRNDTVGLWDLTLQSTAGPVRLTFDNPGRVTLDDWTQYLAISTALPSLPHGGLYTYRGQHERFGFTIQLPVTP